MNDETTRFLARRMRAQRTREVPRCWGRSSDALALYGIGEGPRPYAPGTPEYADGYGGGSWRGEQCGKDYPSDPSDLMACEETYKMAPDEARALMLPVLVEFRAWVLDGINRHGEQVGGGYRGRVIGHPEVFVPGAWGRDVMAPEPVA